MGLFDILELSLNYIQYIILLYGYQPRAPYPSWNRSPLLILNAINMQAAEWIDGLRDPGAAQNSIRSFIPESFPIDARLGFFAIGIMLPFLISILFILLLGRNVLILWLFSFLLALIFIVGGFKGDALPTEFLTSSENFTFSSGIAAAGVVFLVFCGCYAVYWFMVEGVREVRIPVSNNNNNKSKHTNNNNNNNNKRQQILDDYKDDVKQKREASSKTNNGNNKKQQQHQHQHQQKEPVQKRVRGWRSTYELVLQTPIPRTLTLKHILTNDTEETDAWAQIVRLTLVVIGLVLGFASLKTFNTALLPYIGDFGGFSTTVGIVFLVVSGVVGIFTAIEFTEDGRRIMWVFSRTAVYWLLWFALLSMSAMLVPVGQAIFPLLDCIESIDECPQPYYRLPDPSSLSYTRYSSFKRQSDLFSVSSEFLENTFNRTGLEPDSSIPTFCQPLDNFTSSSNSDPLDNNSCAFAYPQAFGIEHSRIATDRTVRCTPELRRYFGGAAALMILNIALIAYLQYYLTKKAAAAVEHEYPLDATSSIGLNREQLIEEKIHASDNVAKVIYAPYRRKFRYWRSAQLVHKLLLIFAGVTNFEVGGSITSFALSFSFHVVFTILNLVLLPYSRRIENYVALSTQVMLCVVSLVGLAGTIVRRNGNQNAVISSQDDDLAADAFYIVLVAFVVLVPFFFLILGYILTSRDAQAKAEERAARISEAIDKAAGADDEFKVAGLSEEEEKLIKREELNPEKLGKKKGTSIAHSLGKSVRGFWNSSTNKDDDEGEEAGKTKKKTNQDEVDDVPSKNNNNNDNQGTEENKNNNEEEDEDENDGVTFHDDGIAADVVPRRGGHHHSVTQRPHNSTVLDNGIVFQMDVDSATDSDMQDDDDDDDDNEDDDDNDVYEEDFEAAEQQVLKEKSIRRMSRIGSISHHQKARLIQDLREGNSKLQKSRDRIARLHQAHEGKPGVSFRGVIKSLFDRNDDDKGKDEDDNNNNGDQDDNDNYEQYNNNRFQQQHLQHAPTSNNNNKFQGIPSAVSVTTYPVDAGESGGNSKVTSPTNPKQQRKKSIRFTDHNNNRPSPIAVFQGFQGGLEGVTITAKKLPNNLLDDEGMFNASYAGSSEAENSSLTSGVPVAAPGAGGGQQQQRLRFVLNQEPSELENWSANSMSNIMPQGSSTTYPIAGMNSNSNNGSRGSSLTKVPSIMSSPPSIWKRNHSTVIAAFAKNNNSNSNNNNYFGSDVTANESSNTSYSDQYGGGRIIRNSNNNKAGRKQQQQQHQQQQQQVDAERDAIPEMSIMQQRNSSDNNNNNNNNNHHHNQDDAPPLIEVVASGDDYYQSLNDESSSPPNNISTSTNKNDSNNNANSKSNPFASVTMFSSMMNGGGSRSSNNLTKSNRKMSMNHLFLPDASSADPNDVFGSNNNNDNPTNMMNRSRMVANMTKSVKQTRAAMGRSTLRQVAGGGGDMNSNNNSKNSKFQQQHRDPLKSVPLSRRKLWEKRRNAAGRIIKYQFEQNNTKTSSSSSPKPMMNRQKNATTTTNNSSMMSRNLWFLAINETIDNLLKQKLAIIFSAKAQELLKESLKGSPESNFFASEPSSPNFLTAATGSGSGSGGGGGAMKRKKSVLFMNSTGIHPGDSSTDDRPQPGMMKTRKTVIRLVKKMVPKMTNNNNSNNNESSVRESSVRFSTNDDDVVQGEDMDEDQEHNQEQLERPELAHNPLSGFARSVKASIETDTSSNNLLDVSSPTKSSPLSPSNNSIHPNHSKHLAFDPFKKSGGSINRMSHNLAADDDEKKKPKDDRVTLLKSVRPTAFFGDFKTLKKSGQLIHNASAKSRSSNNNNNNASSRTNASNSSRNPHDSSRMPKNADEMTEEEDGMEEIEYEEEVEVTDDDEDDELYFTPLAKHPSIVIKTKFHNNGDNNGIGATGDENNNTNQNDGSNSEVSSPSGSPSSTKSNKAKNAAKRAVAARQAYGWRKAIISFMVKEQQQAFGTGKNGNNKNNNNNNMLPRTMSFQQMLSEVGSKAFGSATEHPLGLEMSLAGANNTTSSADYGSTTNFPTIPPTLMGKKAKDLLKLHQALSQPILSLEDEEHIRDSVSYLYEEHLKAVTERQLATDYRIDRDNTMTLSVFFFFMSIISFIALILTLVGINETTRDEKRRFMPVGGLSAESIRARWSFLGPELNLENTEGDFIPSAAYYNLAGYNSWASFVDNCCCAAFDEQRDVDAVSVEKWLCRNGLIKERIRKTRAVVNGSASLETIRPLCGTEFMNGCRVDVGTVSPFFTFLEGCNATVPDSAKPYW